MYAVLLDESMNRVVGVLSVSISLSQFLVDKVNSLLVLLFQLHLQVFVFEERGLLFKGQGGLTD